MIIDVKSLILKEAWDNFGKAEMLEGGKFREVASKIMSHIVKHGRIHEEDFLVIAGSYERKVQLLLCNIFVTLPYSRWITFESKPTELVAREIVAGMKNQVK